MARMDIPPVPSSTQGSDQPEVNHRVEAEELLSRLDSGGRRPPEGMNWPAALTLATAAQAHATLALGRQSPPLIPSEAVLEQVTTWCAQLDPALLERACLEAAAASGDPMGTSPFAALPAVLEQDATQWWLGR